MSQLGVGKEVLSFCNKCKLNLAHLIVTMKDNNAPDKVMCKTCKGTHAFKDQAAAKAKSTTLPKSLKSSKSKGPSKSVAEIWQDAINKNTMNPKSYSIKDTYLMGDLIAHPTFGDGLVEKVIDRNKIEVLFKDDYRTLIHGK